MSTSTPSADASATIVAPFGIEIDHHRNDDVLLQSLPGSRLRSAISGAKGTIDKRGDVRIPVEQSRALASFPPTPGMQIHVNPSERSWAIVDPLNKMPELCERIARYLKEHMGASTTTVKGVADSNGVLDTNRMKTLCRELCWLVSSGDARTVRGKLPDLADVDDLPGDYLLNPGSRVQNTQPQFEKDMDNWIANLSRNGG